VVTDKLDEDFARVADHPHKFPRCLGWKTEVSKFCFHLCFARYHEFLKISFFFAARSKLFSEMLRMNV
jgi:hypothetical protein